MIHKKEASTVDRNLNYIFSSNLKARPRVKNWLCEFSFFKKVIIFKGYEWQNFKAVLGYDGPNRAGRVLRKDRVKPRTAHVWSKWSQFAACNVDCGWGEKIRTRTCQKTDLKTGKVELDNENIELCGAGGHTDSEDCQMEDCVLCQSVPGDVSPFVFSEKPGWVLDDWVYSPDYEDPVRIT